MEDHNAKKSTIEQNNETNKPRHRMSIYNFCQKASKKNPYYDDFTQEEQLLISCILSLKKPSRSVGDNTFVIDFIRTLVKFIDMIKNQSDDLEELLFKISYALKYEYFEENKVIFQFGDKGVKFYLVLQGKVSILIPEKKTFSIPQDEYYAYLVKLKKYNELELISKLLTLNKGIFQIDEQEGEWLKGNIPTLKDRKSYTPLLEYLEKISYHSNTLGMRDESVDPWTFGFDEIKNSKTPIDLSYQNYIKLFTPLKNEMRESKECSVFIYNKVISLNTGDKFGDTALISAQKRSATIISEDDCHLGTLDKASFLKCLSEVSLKLAKINLNLLLSQKIFSTMNKIYFQKICMNLFVVLKMKKGEKITIEGDPAESIFIIKEGQFEISTKKSNIDLCNIIKSFGGRVDKYYEDLDLYRESDAHIKFLKKNIHSKVEIINDKGTIGLKDTILNGKYSYNVELISSKGEVFELKRKFLDLMTKTNPELRDEENEFFENKKSYWVERLTAILETRFRFYKTFKLDEEGGSWSNSIDIKSANKSLFDRNFKVKTKFSLNMGLENNIIKNIVTQNKEKIRKKISVDVSKNTTKQKLTNY